MATVEEKLEAVESRFRKNSKRYHAARYIVKLDHEILEDEKRAICTEIPIADKTVDALIRELKKMGLYPPQKPSDISISLPTTEKPKEPAHHVPEAPQPPLQEYVTKEDLEALRNSTNETLENLNKSINNLASLLNEDLPSNPGEDEEEEKVIEVLQPGEIIQPGELIIHEGSATRETVLLLPEIRILYDAAKEGAFYNYAGTQEPGPFANLKKDGKGKIKLSMSDFFNKIVPDYFARLHYTEIGLTTTRYMR